MVKSEWDNIALSTALLFVISISSLIANIDKVRNAAEEIPFPFVEKYYKENVMHIRPSFFPKEKYTYPLDWYIKHNTDKLAFVLAMIIASLKPNFPKWLFTLWIGYGIAIMIDWSLFFEQWPWRYATDVAVLSVHICWFFYKYPNFSKFTQ